MQRKPLAVPCCDALGRPLTHTQANGSTLRWQYNAQGLLSASLAYNANSQCIGQRAIDGLEHRYTLDPLGLPIKVEVFASSDRNAPCLSSVRFI